MAKKGRVQPTFKVQKQAPSQQVYPSQTHTTIHNDIKAARPYQFVITQGDSPVTESAPSSIPSSPGTSDTPSKQFVFASNKSTVAFTKGRKSCEPAPKRRRTNKYPRDDRVAINARKPVKTYIPIDAWALIFERCHPKFLLDARLVCRDFHDILETQTIWREARQQSFPNLTTIGCPSGLTEAQYAELLVGRGCHIKPCVRRDTRKIFWPFMLRMCETCLAQQIQCVKSDNVEARAYADHRGKLEPEIRRTIPEHLDGLLPAGTLCLGKWIKPRPLHPDGQEWAVQGKDYYVLVSDYEKLRSDFRKEVMTEASDFLLYTKTKWSTTRDRMEHAKTLSAFDWNSTLQRDSNRDEKAELFEQKAQELDPPMSPAVLGKMAAYHNVLDNGNAASLRSWDLLAQKIDKPELRAQADQLIEWERPTNTTHLVLESLHDKLFKHRSTVLPTGPPRLKRKKWVPEQEVIAKIAHKELDTLLDVVHDEDVLLLLLDRVRLAYEALICKPFGLNGDGTEGEYKLLLDDARMVVDEVLLPRSGHKGSVRWKKITGSLRCVGCTRNDARRLDAFEQLIVHIRNTHAKFVGPNLHFWKWAVPIQTKFGVSKDGVAWYHIPWPKSMPALPAHRKATKDVIWDPDQQQEYIEHPVQKEFELFNGLQARSQADLARNDFIGNFCHAAKTLAETRLDSLCTVRLSLEYAIRMDHQHCQSQVSSIVLSSGKLQNMEMASLRVAPGLKFKFGCGLCLADKKAEVDGREKHIARDVDSLGSHWRQVHKLQEDELIENLIVLPSDSELHRNMMELDARLLAQQSRAETRDKKRVPGQESEDLGKRDPRTAALLGIPNIRSRFDTLFVNLKLTSKLEDLGADQEVSIPVETCGQDV